MSKGLLAVGALMSREMLWVRGCYWKWDREEWGASVCPFTSFLGPYYVCPPRGFFICKHSNNKRKKELTINACGNLIWYK